MSKISEQKAIELYPENKSYYRIEGYIDVNKEERVGYIKGYDQAMQYFLEKAERYLQNTLYDRVEIEVYGTIIPNIIGKKGFIENFKNYIKNES